MIQLNYCLHFRANEDKFFWRVNCAFNKSCSFWAGAECVNWVAGGGFQAFLPTGARNSHRLSNSWARHPHNSPSFSSRSSAEQPQLHLSITSINLFPRISLPVLGGGILTENIFFFPLAGGFRETRLIFGTWDLSHCISQTLDVLMNKNKRAEKLGN